MNDHIWYGLVGENMGTEKLIVLFDSSCILCQQTKKVLKKFDWLNQVNWISLQEYSHLNPVHTFDPIELRRELHVVDHKGNVTKGFYAVRKLFLLFPLTFIPGLFMYIPYASLVGNPLYKWIAANRHKFLRKKCDNGSCTLHKN